MISTTYGCEPLRLMSIFDSLVCQASCSFTLERVAEPVGCRYSAIHEEVAAGAKRTVKSHEDRADDFTPANPRS